MELFLWVVGGFVLAGVIVSSIRGQSILRGAGTGAASGFSCIAYVLLGALIVALARCAMS